MAMTTSTKKYRESQFNRISEVYLEFHTKIKFIKPNGETNWIDIEIEEFEKIKKILTT